MVDELRIVAEMPDEMAESSEALLERMHHLSIEEPVAAVAVCVLTRDGQVITDFSAESTLTAVGAFEVALCNMKRSITG